MQISQENTYVGAFLNKVAGSHNCNLWKTVKLENGMPKKRMDAALQEKSISQVLLKHFMQEQEVAIQRLDAATRGVLHNKGVVRSFVKFTGKHLCQSLFLSCGAQACNFIKKETPAKVLSYESYEICKNNFFTEHLWATASEGVHLLKIIGNYL